MQLAYVTSDQRGATDRLLSAFAARLAAQGTKLSGVVQSNTPRIGSSRCDMDLTVLAGGPVIRISQSLGPAARGCRLDPSALERAVALVQAGLGPDRQLLIVNKFGKHEAAGRGFRPLIGEALIAGIPILTGVNALNHDAFARFAGNMAEALPADMTALASWFARIRGIVPANG